MDGNGNYYHVEKGKEKQYIACNAPRPGEEDFHTVMERLKEEAGRRAGIAQRKQLQEEEHITVLIVRKGDIKYVELGCNRIRKNCPEIL